MSATEPDEVTVIVVAGKGLQGRKPGRHKYSVIFGIGPKKYRTAVVKDPSGCPEWNEESVIHVNNVLDQVFFIVTEKDDQIGQVNIPVTSLLGPPGRTLKGSLQPVNKKCPNPQGELYYQCFVSSRRPAHQPIIKNGQVPGSPQTNRFKQRLSLAVPPALHIRGKKEKRHSIASFNKKISRSIHDLLGLGNKHSVNEDINEDDEPQNNMGSKYGTRFMSIGSGLDDAGQVPVIISVTPKEGLVTGGTRIVIEGRNLGFNRKDITDLLVCEVDCLDMLEFESPNRIYCTAKPSTPGKGDIMIETKSGGIGTLRNAFTYCEEIPSKCVNPVDSEEKEKKLAVFAMDSDSDVMDNEDLPDIHSPKVLPPLSETSPTSPTSPGKPRKFMKHLRRASEGILSINMRQNGTLKPPSTPPRSKPPMRPPPDPGPTREELMAEIAKLKTENQELKQQNSDMQAYIDKLVTKVIDHCPETLETEQEKRKRNSQRTSLNIS